MKKLLILTFSFLAIVSTIAIFNSCNRDCPERTVQKKNWVIQDTSRLRYAFYDCDSIVFLETSAEDTQELVFRAHRNFDTIWNQDKYLDYGDEREPLWCIDYELDVEGRIDHYYCKERNFHFLTQQSAHKQQITIRFYKDSKPPRFSNNFDFRADIEGHNIDAASRSSSGGVGSYRYIGDTSVLGNGYSQTIWFRYFEGIGDYYRFVYSQDGYVEKADSNYKIQVKQLYK